MLEKYKNLWVKEGGGHLLEGGVFLGMYGTLCLPQNVFVITNNAMIQVTFVLNRVYM